MAQEERTPSTRTGYAVCRIRDTRVTVSAVLGQLARARPS
jgi:uncharacterized protein (DUF433 family)